MRLHSLPNTNDIKELVNKLQTNLNSLKQHRKIYVNACKKYGRNKPLNSILTLI